MRLSLIKSATAPDWNADQGEHLFTYALLPHAGDWVAGSTVEEAWALNNPLRAVRGKHSGNSGKSLITVNQSNIAIDAVKISERGDGFIVRLHEFTGSRSTVSLGSHYELQSWQLCDMMERPLEEARQGRECTHEFKPYEICTFLVKFSIHK